MKIRFTAAAGVSFPSMSMPGSMIRSIEIDNPSASWLLIRGDDVFVPPQTLGFAHNLAMPTLALTVSAVTSGPQGAASVASGDAVVLYISDEPTIEAEGATSASQYVPEFVNPIQILSSYTLFAPAIGIAALGQICGIVLSDTRFMQLRRIRIGQAGLPAANANAVIDLQRVRRTATFVAPVGGISVMGPRGATTAFITAGLVAGDVLLDTLRRYRVPMNAAQPVGAPVLDEFDFTTAMYPPEAQGGTPGTDATSEGFVLALTVGAIAAPATVDISIDFTTIGVAQVVPPAAIR